MAEKTPLFPILLVNFIGTLGFSIVIPFLVVLVTKFGGNAFMYGLLGATYSFFQLIGAPILGRWSDRYGRKKILLLSQAGTLVAWIIFLIALYLPIQNVVSFDNSVVGTFVLTLPLLVLFFARALDGITGGNVSVANAYLADITSDKDRSKNYGRMGISGNLGFMIGPGLAGILGATVLAETLPVLAALFISLVAVFLIMFMLPESNKHMEFKPQNRSVRKVFGQEHKDCKVEKKDGLKDIMRIPGIPYALILYFLLFLGYNVYYTAFPIHAVQGLGWTVTGMGIYFSILSVVMVVVQGPVLSRVAKKFSDVALISSGSFILSTTFALLLSSNVVLIYLAAVTFAIGTGIMWPSFLSLLSKLAGEKHQGAVQGFSSSAGSLASIIGLIFGGIMYDLFGVVAFVVSAVMISLVGFLSLGCKKHKQDV